MLKFSKIIYVGKKSLKATSIGLELKAQRLKSPETPKRMRVITQAVSSFSKSYKNLRKIKLGPGDKL